MGSRQIKIGITSSVAEDLLGVSAGVAITQKNNQILVEELLDWVDLD